MIKKYMTQVITKYEIVEKRSITTEVVQDCDCSSNDGEEPHNIENPEFVDDSELDKSENRESSKSANKRKLNKGELISYIVNFVCSSVIAMFTNPLSAVGDFITGIFSCLTLMSSVFMLLLLFG